MSDSRHGTILKQKLHERAQTLLGQLGGGCAKDYGDYKQVVGQILGLMDAEKLSDEADFEINGG